MKKSANRSPAKKSFGPTRRSLTTFPACFVKKNCNRSITSFQFCLFLFWFGIWCHCLAQKCHLWKKCQKESSKLKKEKKNMHKSNIKTIPLIKQLALFLPITPRKRPGKKIKYKKTKTVLFLNDYVQLYLY